MLGAIIGDIVGSRFEFNNCKSKEFDFFGRGCKFTDDSVMTLAVAKALMKSKPADSWEFDCKVVADNAVKYMRKRGRRYPNCGFGGMFRRWLQESDPQPYNSFGNGAAMRVSPVGFVAQSEQQAKDLSDAVTRVTHNHPEGLKGAEATALAVYLMRTGATKADLKQRIEKDYYPLRFTVDEMRADYHFDETCQGTVPQAIQCFLESTSFEDAIRTAISLGGDSDTLGAIVGGIAEAHYGVPGDLADRALWYLDDKLRKNYHEWLDFLPQQ